MDIKHKVQNGEKNNREAKGVRKVSMAWKAKDSKELEYIWNKMDSCNDVDPQLGRVGIIVSDGVEEVVCSLR